MRERYGLLLSTTVLMMIVGAILLGGRPQSSSAQINNVWTPCGCFCDFQPPYPPVPPDPYVVFNKEPCTGILAADACNRDISNLPADQVRAVCEKVRAVKNFKSFKDTCPLFARYCDPEKKPDTNEDAGGKCENKATPWFDNSTDCADIQEPKVTPANGAVDLSLCGLSVFKGSVKNPADLEMYAMVLKGWVQQRVGSRVCCNKLRDSVRTAKPCDPAVDIDCDGILNQADVNKTSVPNFVLPQIDLYTTQPGAKIDQFPDGLNPDDPDFMPNSTARRSTGVGDCACKWELIKGELKCSPDGKQQHVYVATWRCPVTKAEVFTTKYAPASAPCGQSKRTGMFDYLERRMDLLEFIPAVRRKTTCG